MLKTLNTLRYEEKWIGLGEIVTLSLLPGTTTDTRYNVERLRYGSYSMAYCEQGSLVPTGMRLPYVHYLASGS